MSPEEPIVSPSATPPTGCATCAEGVEIAFRAHDLDVLLDYRPGVCVVEGNRETVHQVKRLWVVVPEVGQHAAGRRVGYEVQVVGRLSDVDVSAEAPHEVQASEVDVQYLGILEVPGKVQALWTAANANIPVVYVISNNSSYRVLKLNMDTYKTHVLKDETPRSQYIGMDFPTPLNIAGIAEATGVHGVKIEDPAELAPAIRSALELGKPTVLDVVIDGSV